MTRIAILLSALFLACDVQRADQLLAWGLGAALEEPPPKRRIVCREGAVPLPLDANNQLAVDCTPWVPLSDGGAR